MFLMWLGEQITARGIGNGISLIIFAGIVAGLPSAIGGTLELAAPVRCHRPHPGNHRAGNRRHCADRLLERAQRRLLIQYPKRQVGNRMFQGDTSHLPLKLNMSGVIRRSSPRRCCSCGDNAGFLTASQAAGWASRSVRARPWPAALYDALCGMIVFFAFFYTAIVFNPKEYLHQLKKHSGFIPGIVRANAPLNISTTC